MSEIYTKAVFFVDTEGDDHYIFATESAKEELDVIYQSEEDIPDVFWCGNMEIFQLSQTSDNRLELVLHSDNRRELYSIPHVSTLRFIDYDI